MPFRSQTETARSGKRQGLRIAGDLSNNEGKVAAAQPFLQGKKRILGTIRRDMDQPVA